MADEKKPGSGAPFHNPFARLGERRGEFPAGTPAAQAGEKAAKGPARAVVRLERKGRGGKEVTLVEKLELAPCELETWLKDLKRGLGCGGVIEGSALVLQGDQRERAEAWLVKRGVRKVTVSG